MWRAITLAYTSREPPGAEGTSISSLSSLPAEAARGLSTATAINTMNASEDPQKTCAFLVYIGIIVKS
jgi:hypothetical protein